MTEQEFKSNLEKCSKSELIEMMVIQWKGCGNILEQMKMGGGEKMEECHCDGEDITCEFCPTIATHNNAIDDLSLKAELYSLKDKIEKATMGEKKDESWPLYGPSDMVEISKRKGYNLALDELAPLIVQKDLRIEELEATLNEALQGRNRLSIENAELRKEIKKLEREIARR